jgi:hypothetical protein
MPPAKNKPGTERYRDERRNDARPKMHGGQWHDHSAPKDLEPEIMAGADAVIDAEGSQDRTGVGRRANAKTSQGRVRRKRMTPVGKGIKPKTRQAKGARRGAKGTNREGNPG